MRHYQALLGSILLVSLLFLPGCICWISDLLNLGKRIQVHDYTNVTLKPCHLLVPEGTPGAPLIAYTGGYILGKGGSDQFPLDDIGVGGQFMPTPEDHAKAFDRLWFAVLGSATFDLGVPCSSVYIALSQDHGPYPEEALEYRVAISNDGVNFTPLPTDTPITLFRRGWSAAGEDPIMGSVLKGSEPPGETEDSGPWPDVLNDDFSARWDLPQPARFIRITPLSSSEPYNEPEIDALKCVKEAPRPPITSEWRWPTDNPEVIQRYADQNPYAGNKYHTGLDIIDSTITCPEGGVGNCSSVFATADGVVEKVFRCRYSDCRYDGDSESDNHNMQGVVILRHNLSDGRTIFSLYAHLGEISGNLYEGQIIKAGTRLGATGVYIRIREDDRWSWPGRWVSHVHFEIKDKPVLHNPSGTGLYWGYTPDKPNYYGYHNPTLYLPSLVKEKLFGVDISSDQGGPSTLVMIDTTTGAGTTIGPIAGFPSVEGLAFSPDGTLFGVSNPGLGGTGELIRIDPATGKAAPVGRIEGFLDLSSLAFAPDGTLFATADETPGTAGSLLIRIDPLTGAGTTIGSIGYPTEAIAFAPDGTLFGAADVTGDAKAQTLITIDPKTGAGTIIGSFGPKFTDVDAIAFSPDGILFGVNLDTGILFKIDTATGAGIIVGPIGMCCIAGLSFEP